MILGGILVGWSVGRLVSICVGGPPASCRLVDRLSFLAGWIFCRLAGWLVGWLVAISSARWALGGGVGI